MWLFLAFGSALFAGITAILAKCGIKNVDSNLATAIRTIVVLFFAWMMYFITLSTSSVDDTTIRHIQEIPVHSLTFLILSGLTTGASWLCYFKALQIGDINKVTPIDKFSSVLTILLALIFLREEINVAKMIGIIGIGIGTYLMIEKKEMKGPSNHKSSWLIYAIFSAVFASLTSILAKVGFQNVDSNLGTAVRTCVVLIMAWLIVFLQKKTGDIKHIPAKSWLFIILSGFSTGASWLCYYSALKDGPASIVNPVDKLSIVVSVTFSYFVFREKLNRKSLMGLILIIIGTFFMIAPFSR